MMIGIGRIGEGIVADLLLLIETGHGNKNEEMRGAVGRNATPGTAQSVDEKATDMNHPGTIGEIGGGLTRDLEVVLHATAGALGITAAKGDEPALRPARTPRILDVRTTDLNAIAKMMDPHGKTDSPRSNRRPAVNERHHPPRNTARKNRVRSQIL